MFIKTETGRLQNLYLLQDVRVIKNEDNTWSVSFIQMNGVAINEGRYATEEEANSVKEKEVAKILDIKE